MSYKSTRHQAISVVWCEACTRVETICCAEVADVSPKPPNRGGGEGRDRSVEVGTAACSCICGNHTVVVYVTLCSFSSSFQNNVSE